MLSRVAALAAFCFVASVHAQDPAAPAAAPTPAEAAAAAPADPSAQFLASLHPQSGEVALPGGIARLKLPDSFYYLPPDDAQKMIEQAWGNPPGSGAGTLGMIVPKSVSPVTQEGWAVVISYNDDGHVSDDDANKIDYADLLSKMQKATEEENQARAKKGYHTVSLAGWAEPPHYDAAEHKIYWAKDLKFNDSGAHTLNYFIRVLGRKGVLELNAVAGMDQLAQVREDMRKVVSFADFDAGNRYADFNSGTDKVAAYGLAALVAGGIAAKTGLLAKIGLMLIAMKKFVILAIAGVAAAFKKLFGGGKTKS